MEELADPVTNAVWFPERYLSTSALGKPRSEEECSAGKLARDFWQRCVKHAKPGPQARFKESLAPFFEAIHWQSQYRDAGAIPDLEPYI